MSTRKTRRPWVTREVRSWALIAIAMVGLVLRLGPAFVMGALILARLEWLIP